MPVAGEASAPAGAVYDGDGRLLLGSGPAFSLGLIADRAFQAVLHNLDEPGDSLWLLPEHVCWPASPRSCEPAARSS